MRHLTNGAGIDVDRHHRTVAAPAARIAGAGAEIDVAAAASEIPAPPGRADDVERSAFGADFRHVDDGDALRGAEHQLVARRREGVVVEIQRRAARLVRQPDHAMAGGGIDPLAAGRRLLAAGGRDGTDEGEGERDESHAKLRGRRQHYTRGSRRDTFPSTSPLAGPRAHGALCCFQWRHGQFDGQRSLQEGQEIRRKTNMNFPPGLLALL